MRQKTTDDRTPEQEAGAEHSGGPVRPPPHDLESERVVLDHCIAAGTLDGAEVLQASDWYTDAHSLLWQAMRGVLARGVALDYSSLAADLRDRGTLERVGGLAYLGVLALETPATVRVRDHVARVLRLARARRLLALTQAAAVLLREGDAPEVATAELARALAEAPAVDDGKPVLSWRYGGDLAQALPERRWAVRGLQIGPGRPTMIAAYAGTAKTVAAQSMLLSYAAGMSVWGQFVVGRGGTALHLDYEQGAWATQRRYQRLAFGLGIDLVEVGGRLGVVSFPRLYLTGAHAEAELEREIQGAELVLVDSLRAAMPGVDENASEVRCYVDMLTRISERTGASIIVIHHAGKAKEGHSDPRQIARGSSALLDAVGCCYVLAMTSRSEPRKLLQVKLPAESDGSEVEDSYLAIEDVEGPDGPTHGLRIVWQTSEQTGLEQTPRQVVDECTERIVAAVRAEPGLSDRRLRAVVRGSRIVFDAALEAALEDGVSRLRSQRSGGGWEYRVGGQGVDA